MAREPVTLPAFFGLAHVSVRLRDRKCSPSVLVRRAYRASSRTGFTDPAPNAPEALRCAVEARDQLARLVMVLDADVLPGLWEETR